MGFSFNEQDMRKYMTDLGHLATVVDVDKDKERTFIQQLRSEIKNSGAGTLLTQYAPLCTLVQRANKLNQSIQKDLVDITIYAIKTIYDEVQKVKDKLENLSRAESKYFQQVLGIAFWLSYTVIDEFNYFTRVASHINGETGQAKGRGKSSVAPSDNLQYSFWAKGKQQLLDTLQPLLKMDLMPVWNANMNLINKKVFYELILRCLTNCVKSGPKEIERMYDFLLDVFTHYISKLELEDQLIHELIFNIMQSDEMARAVGKILIGLQADKNMPNVIKKSIIRAVEILNTKEYEDGVEKGFSVFLLDTGTTFPDEIRTKCMPYIFPFVDSHVVLVRVSVVATFVEILQAQKKEEIDTKKETQENYKALREKLLDHIMDFICDVNVAVRVKAVGYLTKAVEKDGLLIEEVLKVAQEVADRLTDCAVSVRKNAFIFFSVLMSKELSLAKCTPIEMHEKTLVARRNFLKERMQYIEEGNVEQQINVCVKEFTDYINTSFMGKALASRPLPSVLNSAEKAMEHMKKLIQAKKFWETCECFYRATVEYSDDPLFQYFQQAHTFDFYRAYIGNELGIDLATLKAAQNELERSVNEAMESDASENMREVLHHYHNLGILSELIADKVIPDLLLLLEKGTTTDQTESLAFFGKLALYGYQLSSNIEIKILENVRSLGKSSGSILSSFSLIYLKGDDADSPLGFVKTLIHLCERLGPEGREHIKFLIVDMITAKKIHVNELKALWDIVTLRIPNMAENESKVALYLLYVCAKADKALVQSLYDPLTEVTLGERGFKDMEFAHLGLLTLAEYIGQDIKAKDTGLQAVRLPADSMIFTKIYEIIKHCLHPDTREEVSEHFGSVIEIGISIIYSFSLSPNNIISHLVEESYRWFFGGARAKIDELKAAGDDIFEFEMTEKEMIRVMILGGAITANHASYHSRTILEEVKKRKTIRHIDAIPSTPTKRRLRRSFMENSRRRSMGTSMLDDTTMGESMVKADNDELEQVVGQIGFDREIDVIRSYMEALLDDGVICFYWRYVQHACRRYHKLQSSRVRTATLHLFGQCLLVGNKAMDAGIDLFIRLWQHIKFPLEKKEMITMAILLNDSYPNKMEQCNKLILSDLASDHQEVRLMVLDFVIFLTQSDVLKLRDILADTVLCLADESEEIREVTKNFMRECQEKDTMLHTSIPDLIFRTSANPSVKRPKFQEIMKALLGPFKKTNEVSGIVDKLIDQFGHIGLVDERGEDYAFCLTLLPFGERSFKTLVDRVPLYEKYMSNLNIYNSFMQILENAKENCKADGKKSGAIEKFVERLEVAKEKYTHSSADIAKVKF